MKLLCFRAAGFRLATPALVIVVLLSCTIRPGSAQVQATDKSERLKQIQSQGAYFTSDVWKTSYRDGDSYPDGKEFVGVGIQPDIVVHQTVADLRAARDSVLQAALKELKASPKK